MILMPYSLNCRIYYICDDLVFKNQSIRDVLINRSSKNFRVPFSKLLAMALTRLCHGNYPSSFPNYFRAATNHTCVGASGYYLKENRT